MSECTYKLFVVQVEIYVHIYFCRCKKDVVLFEFKTCEILLKGVSRNFDMRCGDVVGRGLIYTYISIYKSMRKVLYKICECIQLHFHNTVPLYGR